MDNIRHRTLWVLAAIVGGAAAAVAQQASFRDRSVAAEKAGLVEPFKGITADGTIRPGLYAIKSTGVSTEPVRKAAETFLAGLTAEQRAKTTFGVDDDEWRK